MSGKSKIEWTNKTWNPITGCTKTSPGCLNCYAETLDQRFHRKLTGQPFVPWTVKAQRETGTSAVTLRPERLTWPLRWSNPSMVFVNSMSDLFHEDVPTEFIRQVLAVMAATPQHAYQILTKRPERMLREFEGFWNPVDFLWFHRNFPGRNRPSEAWPLPNVWLGVSVENQRYADERIPLLLKTPAAVRFISAEPLLSSLDLSKWLDTGYCVNCGDGQSFGRCCNEPVLIDDPGIHWVIVGGESGPRARPCHPDWVRSLRNQCQAAGVPFFFKQGGRWAPLVVNGPLGPNDRWVGLDGVVRIGDAEEDSDAAMRPVGKGKAGAVLDGREWREFPGGMPEQGRQQPRLRVGSLFSGIGGIDLALERAGMEISWQVEIDPACNRVLERHWPNAIRYSNIRERRYYPPVDLICFGFPCQDLSMAGKRKGLDGQRSKLFWAAMAVVRSVKPTWLLIENVHGLLSSNQGRDFGLVLWALAHCGYWWAYRVLDSQFFGLAQRRNRVFIVGHLGNPAGPAEVLFESPSGQRNPAKGRGKRARVAADIAASLRSGGDGGIPSSRGENVVAYPLNAANGGRRDGDGDTNYVVGPLKMGSGHRGWNVNAEEAAEGHLVIAKPLADWRQNGGAMSVLAPDVHRPLTSAMGTKWNGNGDIESSLITVLAFTERTRDKGRTLETQEELAYALTNPGSGGRTHSRQIAGGFGVRRLTPLECERLQGFPDGWTAGESDSARYRMLGNAVSVPVAEWIGRRIVSQQCE